MADIEENSNIKLQHLA
nr:hypothetical protein [Syntrophomonas zehnderi]